MTYTYLMDRRLPYLLVLLVLVSVSTSFQQKTTIQKKVFSLMGLPAPDFTMKKVGGGYFKLSEYRGKVVLIDFCTTWCGPCKAAVPYLKKLHEELKDKGLVVVSVFCSQKLSTVESFVKSHGITWTAVADENSVAWSVYHVKGVPTFLVVDREGVVSYIKQGFIAPRGENVWDVEDAVKRALGLPIKERPIMIFTEDREYSFGEEVEIKISVREDVLGRGVTLYVSRDMVSWNVYQQLAPSEKTFTVKVQIPVNPPYRAILVKALAYSYPYSLESNVLCLRIKFPKNKPEIELFQESIEVEVNSVVSIRGVVKNHTLPTVVDISITDPGGSTKTVSVETDYKGFFNYKFVVDKEGTWTAKAVTVSDRWNEEAASKVFIITVVKTRGLGETVSELLSKTSLIAVVAIVILAGVILVVVRAKRKKPLPPPPPGYLPLPPPPENRLRVLSLLRVVLAIIFLASLVYGFEEGYSCTKAFVTILCRACIGLGA